MSLAPIKLYKCCRCSELAENEGDLLETVEGFQCPSCLEFYEDEADALACCDNTDDDDE